MDRLIKRLFGEDSKYVDPLNKRIHTMIGIDGKIMYASRNHGCVLGYGDEIIGKNMADLLGGEDPNKAADQYIKAKKYEIVESFIKHKNGYYVKIKSDVFPIDGIGVVVFSRPCSKCEQ